MAVLAEGISAIVKVSSIERIIPGGWEGFKGMVENHTLCADGEVARIGFMAPADVHAFTQLLEGHGLCYLREGEAIDLVVADQQRGLCAKSDWAEFGRIPWEGDDEKPVPAVRLKGSAINRLITPDGWTYEDSLSA